MKYMLVIVYLALPQNYFAPPHDIQVPSAAIETVTIPTATKELCRAAGRTLVRMLPIDGKRRFEANYDCVMVQ